MPFESGPETRTQEILVLELDHPSVVRTELYEDASVHPEVPYVRGLEEQPSAEHPGDRASDRDHAHDGRRTAGVE
jgi:hypothetical protein